MEERSGEIGCAVVLVLTCSVLNGLNVKNRLKDTKKIFLTGN